MFSILLFGQHKTQNFRQLNETKKTKKFISNIQNNNKIHKSSTHRVQPIQRFVKLEDPQAHFRNDAKIVRLVRDEIFRAQKI